MALLASGHVGEGDFQADWAFSTRHGGVSEGDFDSCNVGMLVGDDPARVARNRRILANSVGAVDSVYMHQVHGRHVVRVDAIPETSPEADAIVTSCVEVPLTVQVADCVPILLADLEGGQVAAIHAGWRGFAAGVVHAALDEMSARGAVHAWIGPAICPACYEVSAEVHDEVATIEPAASAATRHGTPALDLRAGVLSQLAARGVLGQLVGGCTFEDRDLYSFRRAAGAPTGRQAGIIVLRANDG